MKILGITIGGKAKPLPAPAPQPASATTNRQGITSLLASLPDTAGPVAILYVQSGKLNVASFGADTPVLVRMLGSATQGIGESLAGAKAAS